MTISACKATEGKSKCVLRHNCERYKNHLDAVGKTQSYIKPVFPGEGSVCNNYKPIQK